MSIYGNKVTPTVSFTPVTTLYMAPIANNPYSLVAAVDDAVTNGTQYQIYKDTNDLNAPDDSAALGLTLLNITQFNAAVAALSPSNSLPVMISSIPLATQAAAVQMVEVYHLVLGLSNFPGNGENTDLTDSGFEREIYLDGASLANQIEETTSAGGSVTSQYPIASLASVSARKAGADLTVHAVPHLNLGVVDLYDPSSPIADGVAVELRYQTQQYVVYKLLDQFENAVAVICSQSLLTYLTTNA